MCRKEAINTVYKNLGNYLRIADRFLSSHETLDNVEDEPIGYLLHEDVAKKPYIDELEGAIILHELIKYGIRGSEKSNKRFRRTSRTILALSYIVKTYGNSSDTNVLKSPYTTYIHRKYKLFNKAVEQWYRRGLEYICSKGVQAIEHH